ncbi:Protein-tyrosine phosphatase OS=Streptomyces griseomycini OX=66895 GN=FHS37_000977 PE=4 SV=1 [Streptomyces griseomycini]
MGLPRDSFRILHVSTGNVCRSPITERLTRHAVAERLGVLGAASSWRARAPGATRAPPWRRTPRRSSRTSARTRRLTGRELLDEHVIRADLVLTATRDHRAQVISMGHSAGLRTFTLKEFTRLVNAIDPATLPPLEDGVVVRARALVRAAAALRGWLLAPTAEADEVYDPYGAP